MDLIRLKPEVAGSTGDGTVITNYDDLRSGAALVPSVEHLEYAFDDWLGDDLIESFPCFIVTNALAASLEAGGLSGLELRDVTITVSELWEQLHEDDPTGAALPRFRWFVPTGTVSIEPGETSYRDWSGHDLCLSQRAELIVTDRALAVMRTLRLDQCEVEPLEPG
jgi:hypothetical protein